MATRVMEFSKGGTKLERFFVVVDISTFFSLSKKFVFSSPLFKLYKKVIGISNTPTNNILVFSFSFWFQFIQGIEDKLSFFL